MSKAISKTLIIIDQMLCLIRFLISVGQMFQAGDFTAKYF
jgi:hypothetical protein